MFRTRRGTSDQQQNDFGWVTFYLLSEPNLGIPAETHSKNVGRRIVSSLNASSFVGILKSYTHLIFNLAAGQIIVYTNTVLIMKLSSFKGFSSRLHHGRLNIGPGHKS